MVETESRDDSELNCACHPNPCMGTAPECTTMVVDLAQFEMPDRFERLVVTPSPLGNYVVACLPFFTYGINFGDWVELREPGKEFVRILEKCGLRTLRIAVYDDSIAEAMHKELHRKLIDASFPHEWHRCGYVAILIRDKDDQSRAMQLFESVIEDEVACWEVDPEPFE
jgi:hypothetical protein